MLVSNTIYYFGISTKFYYILSYLTGNSILTITLLYICSYVFKFCNWHRFIITGNLVNVSTVIIDVIIGIPISSKELLILYYIIATIFSLIAIYSKFHCHECTNKETSSK